MVKCIAFLICVWETPGSELDPENATLLDFLGAFLRTSRKILNFPQIRSSYSSPISINLDTILSKLLQATLNNPKYKYIISRLSKMGHKNFHQLGQLKTWSLLAYGETPLGANPLLREHSTYFYSLMSVTGKGGINALHA